VGRVLRGVLVVLVLVGRELFVAVRNGCLAEVPEPSLSDAGLLSAFVFDATVDLRLADDAADDAAGRVGDLVAAVLDVDCRLAAKAAEGFRFSSELLISLFLFSSTKLNGDLGLWPTLGALAAVTLVAGRRALEVGVGRVGGLLSPLTGSCREVEDAVGFVAELGVDVDVRFAAVMSRFGGIPFLGGDFCAACTRVSRIRGVSARFVFLSTSECTFLGEGRDSMGGAPSSDTMNSLQRH